MAASMDDRQKAFESKFAHDADLRFKAEARRNKLLGLWAADLIGKKGDDAAEYAKEVVKSDFQEAGDEDVFRKVRGDLDAAGANVSDEQLRGKMIELMAEAIQQVQSN
ncbi:DUF1476 domain-containing protein [Georhizobium profundi]|jgi:hypothetical protein|uniref:DUF1476 domain-containing protein n=1 Tax=Georhizobium profundi TaxID=2341112 RepID=A0A3Q8XQK1_9HYPH|nr:DUF1476 domain-containing protein [Georhizobium profundi]AZN71764.1 DUF1476 domain-containing protein [Georhizobium profundi]